MSAQTEADQAIKTRIQFLTQCARCNPHAQADYMPQRVEPLQKGMLQ